MIINVLPFGGSLNWKSVGNVLMDAVLIESKVFVVDISDTVKILGTTIPFGQYKQSSTGLKTYFNFSGELSTKSTKKFLAVVDRNIDSLQQLRSSYRCSSHNPNRKACSHICLPGLRKTFGQCQCPAYLRLSKDGLNCIPLQSQSETTTKDIDEDEIQVENYSTDDLSSTTLSILQSSMNYSDFLNRSKSNNANFVTNFLLTLLIIILILAGIIMFLVFKQSKNRHLPLTPKPFLRNISLQD